MKILFKYTCAVDVPFHLHYGFYKYQRNCSEVIIIAMSRVLRVTFVSNIEHTIF